MTCPLLARIVSALLVSATICAPTLSWAGLPFQTQAPVRRSQVTSQTPVARIQVPTAPPVLTLRAENQTPIPGQNLHFTATWNRKVGRIVYRFEWGDGQSTDSQQPAADHSYSRPGSYVVRVTARSLSE